MFGFGFFILIVVSAYVANLAAFLTKSGVNEYIGTIEEVNAKGLKVCANPALKNELETAHPSAKFVYSQGDTSYYGMVEDYKSGKCDFIAADNDLMANIELMDIFCERNVRSVTLFFCSYVQSHQTHHFEYCLCVSLCSQIRLSSTT